MRCGENVADHIEINIVGEKNTGLNIKDADSDETAMQLALDFYGPMYLI